MNGISSAAIPNTLNKYGYQGDFSENDAETALDEFNLRHYDPQLGRWTTTDPYEQFASPYLGIGNNPVSNVDPDGGCIYCETADRALTLSEVVITIGKHVNPSSSLLSNLLVNLEGFINPAINSTINALSKTGSGVSWFANGLWNEGALPTLDWFNHNLNPVYSVFNGVNSQFTHQDFFNGTPMTHAEGITDAALPFIPFGKVGGVIEKTVLRNVEEVAAKKLALKELPTQLHHFATNKSATYTGRMAEIANQFGLKLEGSWNTELMPHLGRHPNLYHDFVLQGMRDAASGAGGSQEKFLDLFNIYVKQPVIENPLLLRKAGW